MDRSAAAVAVSTLSRQPGQQRHGDATAMNVWCYAPLACPHARRSQTGHPMHQRPAHLLADFVQVAGLELQGEAVQVRPAGSKTRSNSRY